jgi:uncharacterized protein (TIGR02145 family)
MKTRNFTIIFVSGIVIAVSVYSCEKGKGDIKGTVTNAVTVEPVKAATVILNPSYDTTTTGDDGTYQINNVTEGEYEIQTSKKGYLTDTKNIEVFEDETREVDFAINKISFPILSIPALNFGMDLTSLNFTINNPNDEQLTYDLSTNQDWITVSPSNGVITNETVTITVTINRSGLSPDTYKEFITVTSSIGADEIPDTSIMVYLNGLMDEDFNYYRIVTIGTQTWMAENLNTGKLISGFFDQTDNDIIERYCYNENEINCDEYGGLYQWDEVMQFNPSDSGITGNTQGICPDGWHIPTKNEWQILIDYLGGNEVAGGKMKEAGTSHWYDPNTGATNESGFTALPGGNVYFWFRINNWAMGWAGFWWSSTKKNQNIDSEIYTLELYSDTTKAALPGYAGATINYNSVRCIKD